MAATPHKRDTVRATGFIARTRKELLGLAWLGLAWLGLAWQHDAALPDYWCCFFRVPYVIRVMFVSSNFTSNFARRDYAPQKATVRFIAEKRGRGRIQNRSPARLMSRVEENAI